MRLLIQRVSEARVEVDDRVVGAIDQGLLVFVGVARDDTAASVAWCVRKICELRVFAGDEGKGFDRSVIDVGGAVLLVSQFTLHADVRKGRRPAFDGAAPAERARPLFEALVSQMRATGVRVATGEFQATMRVALVNDGPVTLLVDTP